MNLQAENIRLHTSNGSRSRTPFSGVLATLDTVSNFAPVGAPHERRIILTSQAARGGLHTLLGMGINFDHDRMTKRLGVITAAEVHGTDLRIQGYFYGDHPEEVQAIKEHKDELGLSFEASRCVYLDSNSPILTVTSLVFTGAAVLLKSKAAYTMTSLAASAAARAPPNIPPVPAARAINTTKERHMPDYVTRTEFPAKAPLKVFPFHFGNATALLHTLDNIGALPDSAKGSIKALAAAGQKLGAGGARINVHELDAILATYDINLQKRMQLKAAMSQQGLL
jgi:hypothetical protein